jgi:hypothetical protein
MLMTLLILAIVAAKAVLPTVFLVWLVYRVIGPSSKSCHRRRRP